MEKINYYPGRINYVIPIGTLSMIDFIRANKQPLHEIIESIVKIRLETDKVKKRSLKGQLYYFTPCVLVKAGKPRRYENIEKFTGYIHLDFDKLVDNDPAEFRDYLFDNYDVISTAYVSPSGKGVKALLKIPVISLKNGIDHAIKEFKDYYRAVELQFSNYEGFDHATVNPILPLFISYDPHIRYREDTSTWNVKEYEEVKPNMATTNLNLVDNSKQFDYYYRKTVRILQGKFNNIVDNGHPQVIRASLILGSRVGAGYISRSDAEGFIIQLIENNTYLQKGIDGYIKTAMWGVEEGIKQPKNYI